MRRAVARIGAPRWTAIGVGATEARLGPDTAGTFAGFGADVPVQLGRAASAFDPELPLAALIAGWLRPADVDIDMRLVAPDDSPVFCTDLGRAVRAEIDADPQPHGVLIVADGASTLTPKAPGAFDERSVDFQADVDRALQGGDPDALAVLDPVVCAELGAAGRPAWQVLAGLIDAPKVENLYCAAPFGVAYYVGVWS